MDSTSSKTNNTPEVEKVKWSRDAVRDIVDQMNLIGTTLVTLNEQSAKIPKVVPGADDFKPQLKALLTKLSQHHDKLNARFEEVKKRAEEGGGDIVHGLEAKVQEQVRSQITAQAKQQVEDQVRELLPVSLQQQSEEYRRQIKEVKDSLANSHARRGNARIPATDVDEQLQVVLKKDGTKSALYPANLRSLYDYDETTCKELVRDYEIEEDGAREVNLSRFMAHIGLEFRVAVPQT